MHIGLSMKQHSGQKHLVLEKVTLNYVATEDRISMQAQVKEGEPMTFWLTLRLCRELVRAFVGYLDSHVATAKGGGKSVLQTYYQEEAMVRKTRTASVDASASTLAPVLVKEVSLRSNADALVMRLPMPDGTMAAMPLKAIEARQLLQILHVQFKKADWPLDIWPAWMSDSSKVDALGGKGPIH
ncbi:MAG TPA: hypothetical protein VK018_09640 [Porticoccaceae bacterium]|nr:hypothetical protein [Porticoccaceae bacterium]